MKHLSFLSPSSKEHGQSSLTILWSLHDCTSGPKAPLSRDRPNSEERPYVCLYKKHTTEAEKRSTGDCTELRSMLPFPTLRTEMFYTKTIKKACLLVGRLVVVWAFIFSMGLFCVDSSLLERSRHPGPYSSCPSVCWRGQGSRETNQHPEKTNTIVSYSKYKGPWGTVIL